MSQADTWQCPRRIGPKFQSSFRNKLFWNKVIFLTNHSVFLFISNEQVVHITWYLQCSVITTYTCTIKNGLFRHDLVFTVTICPYRHDSQIWQIYTKLLIKYMQITFISVSNYVLCAFIDFWVTKNTNYEF